MHTSLEIWTSIRKSYNGFFEKFSLEQLNKIPDGFSNNLIWNLGHILVVQQGLCYRTSGLEMNITTELYDTYKNDTKPNSKTGQAEVDLIQKLINEMIDSTKVDYENARFSNFNSFTTSTGFSINNIEDAIAFNNFHEGLHIGFMMNIRKFI